MNINERSKYKIKHPPVPQSPPIEIESKTSSIDNESEKSDKSKKAKQLKKQKDSKPNGNSSRKKFFFSCFFSFIFFSLMIWALWLNMETKEMIIHDLSSIVCFRFEQLPKSQKELSIKDEQKTERIQSSYNTEKELQEEITKIQENKSSPMDSKKKKKSPPMPKSQKDLSRKDKQKTKTNQSSYKTEKEPQEENKKKKNESSPMHSLKPEVIDLTNTTRSSQEKNATEEKKSSFNNMSNNKKKEPQEEMEKTLENKSYTMNSNQKNKSSPMDSFNPNPEGINLTNTKKSSHENQEKNATEEKKSSFNNMSNNTKKEPQEEMEKTLENKSYPMNLNQKNKSSPIDSFNLNPEGINLTNSKKSSQENQEKNAIGEKKSPCNNNMSNNKKEPQEEMKKTPENKSSPIDSCKPDGKSSQEHQEKKSPTENKSKGTQKNHKESKRAQAKRKDMKKKQNKCKEKRLNDCQLNPHENKSIQPSLDDYIFCEKIREWSIKENKNNEEPKFPKQENPCLCGSLPQEVSSATTPKNDKSFASAQEQEESSRNPQKITDENKSIKNESQSIISSEKNQSEFLGDMNENTNAPSQKEIQNNHTTTTKILETSIHNQIIQIFIQTQKTEIPNTSTQPKSPTAISEIPQKNETSILDQTLHSSDPNLNRSSGNEISNTDEQKENSSTTLKAELPNEKSPPKKTVLEFFEEIRTTNLRVLSEKEINSLLNELLTIEKNWSPKVFDYRLEFKISFLEIYAEIERILSEKDKYQIFLVLFNDFKHFCSLLKKFPSLNLTNGKPEHSGIFPIIYSDTKNPKSKIILTPFLSFTEQIMYRPDKLIMEVTDRLLTDQKNIFVVIDPFILQNKENYNKFNEKMKALWMSNAFLKNSSYIFIYNAYSDLGVITNQKEVEFQRTFKDKTWKFVHLKKLNVNGEKSFSDLFQKNNEKHS